MTPAAISYVGRLVRRRLRDYLALAKPRVVLMVLVTTTVGYLGDHGARPLKPGPRARRTDSPALPYRAHSQWRRAPERSGLRVELSAVG